MSAEQDNIGENAPEHPASHPPDTSEDLRLTIAGLTARVYALEQALNRVANIPPPAPRPASSTTATTPSRPDTAAPQQQPWQPTQTLQSGALNPAPPFKPAVATLPTRPQNQRSLESRIGSFFVNRIGVVAVMIGMALFLKLAIDRNWIGPPVRVAIGLAVAVGLILWSERFRRRKYIAFSFSLKALGTGIAYLSLWAAYSVYSLISPSVAFAAMVIVTIVNGVLAWLQDSELLAVYALAGGLATPALLSTGQDHELFLFSYLLLLDLGAVALCALRPWNRLILGAFVGTAVYFAMWWAAYYTGADFALTGIFLLLFFLLFTAAPLLGLHLNSRRFRTQNSPGPDAPPPALDFYDRASRGFMVTGLPIAVHATTFLAAWYWAGTHVPTWPRSWIALLLAVSSLAVDLLVRGMEDGFSINTLHGNHPADLSRSPIRPSADLLADIHFGLAIFFVAFAAWLEYHRHNIGLPALIGCWLAEALVLAAVITLFPPHHHRPATAADHVTLPRVYATLMVLGVSVTLLLLEYLDPPANFVLPSPPIVNTHFLTYLAALAVFAATAWLCERAILAHATPASAPGTSQPAALPLRNTHPTPAHVEPGTLYFLAAYAVIAFNLIALIAGAVQIHLYWLRDDLHQSALHQPPAGPHIIGFSYSAWFMFYGAVLMAAGFLRRSAFLRWQALVLLAFAIGKVFIVDASQLTQGYRVMSFLGLGALLLTISFAYQRDWLNLRTHD